MEAILAREIKTFRKQFRSEHGRDPSKRDIERHPDIAASYSTWLAIKADKTSASASSSKHTVTKTNKIDSSAASTSQRRVRDSNDDDARTQKSIGSHSNNVGMAPPPTTPRRNKVTKDISMVRTPKRPDSASMDVEMESAVHDSAGSVRSVIDVPSTPKQHQPNGRRHDRNLSTGDGEDDDDDNDLTTPSPSALSSQRRRQTAFDNANSPSKLRSLIASFGVNMGKLTKGNTVGGLRRTPTKSDARKSGIEEEDERLKRSLQISKTAVPQNGNLFTPRTKARKRLRGELVVTPSKSSERGSAVGAEGVAKVTTSTTTPTKAAVARPAKRQRGMGTLKDFGIVAIAGPQAKTMGHAQQKTSASVSRSTCDEDDDDDDNGEDLIGPSPSARRVVVMPMPVFRPLFDDAAKASALAAQLAPSSSQQSIAATATIPDDDGDVDTDTALTTPAVQEEEIDSDEEDRRMVRAYQRYEPTPRRHAHDGFDDETEEDVLGGLAAFVGTREDEVDVHAVFDEAQGQWDEEDEVESSMLRSLSIASPQCKRARRQQRRMAAQSVRDLLHTDAAALEVGDAQDEGEHDGEEAGGAAATDAKTKPGVTVHGNGKTARMMRGTLTKTARRNLAAAELADEQRALAEAAAESKDSTALPTIRANSNKAKTSMILRRGRDDDGDDDEEEDDSQSFDLRSHHSHAGAADDEDDDWASDVDSVDYGLGDGYMDDADVL